MTEYDLKEGFGVDDDELDGFTPQKCFVLGYELAMISALLDNPDRRIAQPIHPENQDRLQKAANKRGRNVRFIVYHDDWFWMETLN